MNKHKYIALFIVTLQFGISVCAYTMKHKASSTSEIKSTDAAVVEFVLDKLTSKESDKIKSERLVNFFTKMGSTVNHAKKHVFFYHEKSRRRIFSEIFSNEKEDIKWLYCFDFEAKFVGKFKSWFDYFEAYPIVRLVRFKNEYSPDEIE